MTRYVVSILFFIGFNLTYADQGHGDCIGHSARCALNSKVGCTGTSNRPGSWDVLIINGKKRCVCNPSGGNI